MAQPQDAPQPKRDTSQESQPVKDSQQYSNVFSQMYGPRSKEELQASNSRDKDNQSMLNGDEKAYLDMDTGKIVKGDADSETKKGEDGTNSPQSKTKESEKMLNWFSKNFETLDLNGNGKLSSAEIGANLLDPKVANGEGSTYLATAFQRAQSFEAAAKDVSKQSQQKAGKPKEGEYEPATNSGITKDGLELLKDGLHKLDSKEVQDKFKIASLANGREFSDVDTNYDSTITREELKQAKSNEKLSPETKEKLALLEANFDKVAQTSDDWIPPRDAGGGALTPGYKAEPKESKDNPDIEFVSHTDVSRFASQSNQFLSGLEEKINGINDRFQKDNQGFTGSCFVLAPTYGLEEKNQKELLTKMVKDNKDGTSTVTFPGDKENPVTINNPTEAELKTFASGPNSIHPIIEKAFAQRDAKEFGALGDFEAKPGIDGKEGKLAVPIQGSLTDGGDPKRAMQVLLGAKPEVRATHDAEIEKILGRGNDKDHLVIAATKDNVSENSQTTEKHAYWVSGYDAAKGEVEVSNPYKSNNHSEPTNAEGKPLDGVKDGKFKISLKQFQADFDLVYTHKLDKK